MNEVCSKYYDYRPTTILDFEQMALLDDENEWAKYELERNPKNSADICMYVALKAFREFQCWAGIGKGDVVRMSRPDKEPLEMIVELIFRSPDKDCWTIIGKTLVECNFPYGENKKNEKRVDEEFAFALFEKISLKPIFNFSNDVVTEYPDLTSFGGACRFTVIEPGESTGCAMEMMPPYHPVLKVAISDLVNTSYERWYAPILMMSENEYKYVVWLNEERMKCHEDEHYEMMSRRINLIAEDVFNRHTGICRGVIIEVDDKYDSDHKGRRPPKKLEVTSFDVEVIGSLLVFVISGNLLKKNGEVGEYKRKAYPLRSMIRVFFEDDGEWHRI